MTTVEIRDKILEQKTLYQKSLEVSAEAKEKIATTLAGIDDNTVNLLLKEGIDIRGILLIDLDRLQEDAEYAKKCSNDIKVLVNKIHDYLEEAISV